MRVAASLVYFELRHNVTGNDRALDRALNDAALALAQIADVFYENEAGHVLRIQEVDLQNGRFEEGAKIYRTRAGQAFTTLSIRRIDLMYAMEVLHKASRAIGAANENAAPETVGEKPA